MRKFLRKLYNELPYINVVMLHHVADSEPRVFSCIISEKGFCDFVDTHSIIDIKQFGKGFKKNCGKWLITVDDCLDDLYFNVYRIMKERSLPFTAFVSADLVGQPGYITTEQLIEMANDPLVTIGSHGCLHKKLPLLSDEEVSYEISGSKAKLEGLIGKRVEYFAYPHGEAGKREIKLAKKSGYKLAFGVKPRKTNKASKLFDRFILPRYNLANGTKL